MDLSHADTVLLGRLFGVGIFWTQPGHAPAYATCEAALPKNLGDLFEETGSIEPGFEELLDQHWHPGMKISAENEPSNSMPARKAWSCLSTPDWAAPRHSVAGGEVDPVRWTADRGK